MLKSHLLPLIVLMSINLICYFAESRRHKRNYNFLKYIDALELNEKYMQLFYILSYLAPFVCLLESFLFHSVPPKSLRLFALFALFQTVCLRYWSINSLGRYWTKRCIFPSGLDRVMDGPYRFLRHPEYIARILETFFWGLFFFAPSACSVLVIYFIYLYLKITKDEHEQLEDLSIIEDNG